MKSWTTLNINEFIVLIYMGPVAQSGKANSNYSFEANKSLEPCVKRRLLIMVMFIRYIEIISNYVMIIGRHIEKNYKYVLLTQVCRYLSSRKDIIYFSII